jgi:hypothetical protein
MSTPKVIRTMSEIPWTCYEEASHLIVGYNAKGGGILATAKDELTGRRYAKLCRAAGYPDAVAVPNTEKEIGKVNQACVATLVGWDG